MMATIEGFHCSQLAELVAPVTVPLARKALEKIKRKKRLINYLFVNLTLSTSPIYKQNVCINI